MKLNPAERINILSILPKEGSITTLRIIRDLQSELSFTEEEYKDCVTIITVNGQQQEVIKPERVSYKKEVNIGEKASEIIKKALQDLNSQDKLNFALFSIYEIFVEGKKVEDAAAIVKAANSDVESKKD